MCYIIRFTGPSHAGASQEREMFNNLADPQPGNSSQITLTLMCAKLKHF
jgi:hypothetical protein